MLDDHIIYYYNSSSDFGTPMPEWLNHSEGSEFWKELTRNLKYNRHVMEKAVQLTSERFNHSHGKANNLYQIAYISQTLIFFSVSIEGSSEWIAI